MLIEHEKDETQQMLEKLNEAEFQFQATGSRYFHLRFRMDADFDFFAQFSGEVSSYLETLGFELIFDDRYQDQFTKQVWRWKNIDIQLVHSFAHKNRAQLFVKSYVPLAHLSNKAVSRVVWDIAFNATK